VGDRHRSPDEPDPDRREEGHENQHDCQYWRVRDPEEGEAQSAEYPLDDRDEHVTAEDRPDDDVNLLEQVVEDPALERDVPSDPVDRCRAVHEQIVQHEHEDDSPRNDVGGGGHEPDSPGQGHVGRTRDHSLEFGRYRRLKGRDRPVGQSEFGSRELSRVRRNVVDRRRLANRRGGTENDQRDEHQRDDTADHGEAGGCESGGALADSRCESLVQRSEDDREQTGRQHVLHQREHDQCGERAEDTDRESEKRGPSVHSSATPIGRINVDIPYCPPQ